MHKLIKENDTHVWRKTESGLGYVYSKTAFWLFLEKEAEDIEKLEIEMTKKYAETLIKIYGRVNDNDPSKDQETSGP